MTSLAVGPVASYAINGQVALNGMVVPPAPEFEGTLLFVNPPSTLMVVPDLPQTLFVTED